MKLPESCRNLGERKGREEVRRKGRRVWEREGKEGIREGKGGRDEGREKREG